MDFETLINSPKEVIKEYLDEPQKLVEMKINIFQLSELIKATDEVCTYIEDKEKLSNILVYTETFSEEDRYGKQITKDKEDNICGRKFNC